jgi:lipopolysaccharide/colanic/teichoic acid biosynthesis glycosyltransferase
MSTAPQQQEVLRSSSSTTSTETFVSPDAFASAEGLANVYTGVPLLWRMLEIVVSLFALVFFAPVMLIIALVIKRDTPGPALFFQQRVGQGMKPFKFVKFRTLYADARQRYPELYAYDYSDDELRDLKFKVEHDPRVTRQGRWLRRSSLDELPNFWNVLKGDMALVGPRPEIPEMLPYYTGEMRQKFSVRPGITGLAQTSGRGRLKFLEGALLDLEYVRRRSVWLDLWLIVKTVWLIFLRDGAF